MKNEGMLCRSGATMGFDSSPREAIEYSWSRDDVDQPRTSATAEKSSTMHLVRPTNVAAKASGSTVDEAVGLDDDDEFVEPLVPIVQVARPSYRIRGRVRVVARRAPHIPDSLLDLGLEDE